MPQVDVKVWQAYCHDVLLGARPCNTKAGHGMISFSDQTTLNQGPPLPSLWRQRLAKCIWGMEIGRANSKMRVVQFWVNLDHFGLVRMSQQLCAICCHITLKKKSWCKDLSRAMDMNWYKAIDRQRSNEKHRYFVQTVLPSVEERRQL